MNPQLKTLLEAELVILEGKDKELLAISLEAEKQAKRWADEQVKTRHAYWEKARETGTVRCALEILNGKIPYPCAICSKPSNVHISELKGEQIQEVHLCDECAKQKGITDAAGLSLADLLMGLGTKKTP